MASGKEEIKAYVLDKWESPLVKAAVVIGLAGIAAQKASVRLLQALTK